MTHASLRALVLVLVENKHLPAHVFQTLQAAVACAPDSDVLLMGHDLEMAAQTVAKIACVSQVYVADGPALAQDIAENRTRQVLALLQRQQSQHSQSNGLTYSHLLIAADSMGKNLAPRLAASIDAPQISEITQVCTPDTFERPIYAGNAVATVQSSVLPVILTVRTSAFSPLELPENPLAAPITLLPVVEADPRITFIKRENHASSTRPELTSAKVVISGGRALGSSEQFESVLGPLADVLGGALGASRAAVDAGYAPNDWQVGQTGKIVAPKLYIACGISGAVQHLAGMKSSKVIVAINQDPDAPICAIANYSLHGDLFVVIPELVARLQSLLNT
jgi:electron transfer flavoprotein alpha subunit